MQDDGQQEYEFLDDCCEIELPERDLQSLMLDKRSILLELRPSQNSYGVFYTAKGREWDIWCHSGDWDNPGGVEFARQKPMEAARELLKRSWRSDFGFAPDEDD